MKKKYQSPTQQVYQVSAQQILATSDLNINSSGTIDNSTQILTKEDRVTSKDLWDEEW